MLRGGEGPHPEDCQLVRNDWSDLHLQLEHATCCRSAPERRLLRIANDKITLPLGSSFDNYWGKQSAWHKYDILASVIACSTYARREDLIRCGYCSFRCRDTWFCPLCCYRGLAWTLLDEYGDAFSADNQVWYLVLSLSADPDESHRLIFHNNDGVDLHQLRAKNLAPAFNSDNYGIPFTTEADVALCRRLWQIIADTVKRFTGSGPSQMFSGVVGGPELAIRLQPLRVLPHCNYIVWTPGFSVDDARKLRRHMRKLMRDCRPLKKCGLYPSLACYRIPTAEDLRSIVKYMCKPIDLAQAYLSASELVNYEPTKMISLNIETNNFLQNLPLVFRRLNRISRFGRCCAVHHQYFGQVTPYRRRKRDRDAERRRVQESNRAAVGMVNGTKSRKKSPIRRSEKVLRTPRNRPRRPRFYYWSVAKMPGRPVPPGNARKFTLQDSTDAADSKSNPRGDALLPNVNPV
jgi:hypothetical protein